MFLNFLTQKAVLSNAALFANNNNHKQGKQGKANLLKKMALANSIFSKRLQETFDKLQLQFFDATVRNRQGNQGPNRQNSQLIKKTDFDLFCTPEAASKIWEVLGARRLRSQALGLSVFMPMPDTLVYKIQDSLFDQEVFHRAAIAYTSEIDRKLSQRPPAYHRVQHRGVQGNLNNTITAGFEAMSGVPVTILLNFNPCIRAHQLAANAADDYCANKAMNRQDDVFYLPNIVASWEAYWPRDKQDKQTLFSERPPRQNITPDEAVSIIVQKSLELTATGDFKYNFVIMKLKFRSQPRSHHRNMMLLDLTRGNRGCFLFEPHHYAPELGVPPLCLYLANAFGFNTVKRIWGNQQSTSRACQVHGILFALDVINSSNGMGGGYLPHRQYQQQQIIDVPRISPKKEMVILQPQH